MKDHLINEQIRFRELRIIGPDGAQLGVMSCVEAKRMAADANLDLVAISPQATPPVCKIMDYGKFKYETVKKLKEQKKNQKIVELKEVWLSTTIDTGDMLTKAKSAQKFLTNGDKVKVGIKLRGRQQARPELGVKVLENFYEILQEYGLMEKKPLQEGRNILMILTPLTNKK